MPVVLESRDIRTSGIWDSESDIRTSRHSHNFRGNDFTRGKRFQHMKYLLKLAKSCGKLKYVLIEFYISQFTNV